MSKFSKRTTNDRLRLAREKAGFSSATEASARVGKSSSTYRAHENGQNDYSLTDAQTYAAAFGVSAEWLFFGGDAEFKDWSVSNLKNESGLGGAKITPHAADIPDSYRLVPEYDVHVSAGGGAIVEGEQETSRWPFNPAYISDVLGLNSARLAIVEVRGDSMYPTLTSGDRVLVNMSDTQISQSGIFVLFDGGGTVVKRVDKRIGNDETVTLISDNTIHERYDVHLDDLHVVGRVVWVARKL